MGNNQNTPTITVDPQTAAASFLYTRTQVVMANGGGKVWTHNTWVDPSDPGGAYNLTYPTSDPFKYGPKQIRDWVPPTGTVPNLNGPNSTNSPQQPPDGNGFNGPADPSAQDYFNSFSFENIAIGTGAFLSVILAFKLKKLIK